MINLFTTVPAQLLAYVLRRIFHALYKVVGRVKPSFRRGSYFFSVSEGIIIKRTRKCNNVSLINKCYPGNLTSFSGCALFWSIPNYFLLA